MVYERLTQRNVDSENNHGGSSNDLCFTSGWMFKKTSYGVKDASGRVQSVSVRRAV